MPAHHIHITGIVQGVGFRPFVYGLATRLGLVGWIRNTSAGVDIEIEGAEAQLDEFIRCIKEQPPPLAHIDTLAIDSVPTVGYAQFEIVHSEQLPGAFQPISPDIATCPDCLKELLDPTDRRFLYPFTNCTNCGPRFTIITDIPYDRPNTTMAGFALCPACAQEYADPRNRRFHAQPVACPDCGPHIWLENSRGEELDSHKFIDQAFASQIRPSNLDSLAAISQAQRLLETGGILGIKGLGGFHLACNAADPAAVAELRQRKLRVDKPFAVMMSDLQVIEQHCYLSSSEREMLLSPSHPIVILRQREDCPLTRDVAPGQDTLGVMLPYTPLHYMLFHPQPGNHPPQSLIMTSGNLSEEPIAFDNDEARTRLAPLVDGFLLHDRPIRTRCDDSVARITTENTPYFIRRSRGYAPEPIRVPWDMPPLLAVGPELKNTFCLARGPYAFLSHHIGDMENYETLQSFEDGIQHFERLFRVKPEALAYDLHPNYLSTRYALERAERERIQALAVQHHHAHIAACMAENGLPDQPVIGISLDGTGYGSDGHIWGGEFIIADYRSFTRIYHLEYMPLPGGDAAIRNPARTALAYLWANGIDWDPALPCVDSFCAEDRMRLRMQLEHKINTPLTSSMGRLFDAVAAIAGVRQRVNYEAQAAIELEALCDLNESGSYPIAVPSPTDGPVSLSLKSLLEACVSECMDGQLVSVISARFHFSIALLVWGVVMSMRNLYPNSPIVLSGGVWQNQILLQKTVALLRNEGIRNLFIHTKAPTNDGGLSLGQIAIAYHRLLG